MSSFFRKKKPIVTPSQHHHTRFYHEQKWGSIYECYGCHQPGSGPYCSCNDGCNLYYHPRCSELLSSGSSSAAPVGDYPPYWTGYLVLKETAPRTVRSCVACGDGVRMLRYKWRHKKAYSSYGSRNPYWGLYRHLVNRAFHPLCVSLPAQIERIGQHRVVLHLTKKIRGKCLLCKGNSKGWAYNSTCWNYCCHVGCMRKEIYGLQQKSGKSKLTIYLKKSLGLILAIAKVALQLIIEALLGFKSGIWQSIAAEIVGIALEVFEL